MNRRRMIMLSGAAAAAGQGIVRAEQPARPNAAQLAAYKTLAKLGKPKSSYKIPKTEAKKAKYLDSLTAALTLAPDQRQQAASIFTDALAARATLHSSLKTARQNLSDAVRNGDSAAIDQTAATIATLKARLTSTGANAHAAFFRILSSDQRASLAQFQS